MTVEAQARGDRALLLAAVKVLETYRPLLTTRTARYALADAMDAIEATAGLLEQMHEKPPEVSMPRQRPGGLLPHFTSDPRPGEPSGVSGELQDLT